MKKVIYILSALILVLVLAALITSINLSSVASFAMGRAIKGEVHVSRVNIVYKAGAIILDFGDIQVKGHIEGQAKTLQLVVSMGKRFYLKEATVSDFELSLPEATGKAGFFSVPHELFEAKRGTVTYNKQRFIINEARIKNLMDGKPFAFEIGIRNDDLFGTLNASGEGGFYKGLATDVKGRLNVTSLNLNKLAGVMHGRVHMNGAFTYEKKRFVYEGPFEVFNYILKDPIFRNPFSVAEARGKFSFAHAGDIIDIKIRDGKFKDTPLSLDLKFKNNNLATLELGSDLLDIQDVKEIIALDNIAKTDFKIWNYMDEGKVRIKKFLYDVKNPPYADLELEDVAISYKDMHFTDVEGRLSFDDKNMNLSGATGIFRASSFNNVTGVIPFSKEKDIRAKGNYVFNLKDIPPLLGMGEIDFKSGETEGAIEIKGNMDKGYKINGAGKLNNADIIWKRQSLFAKGAYKFSNDGIIFDPLIIDKDETSMVISGRWNENNMDIKMKGNLDVNHIKPFAAIPFHVGGIVKLDMDVQKKEKDMRAKGNYVFNLKDIPPLLGMGEIDFKSGETEGAIEIKGNMDKGYKINGAGKLNNADIIWKRQSLFAKGAYKFSNDGIIFDPLIIDKDETSMVISGRWNENNMDIKMKGNLDVNHIKPFAAIPFHVGGIVKLDMDVQKDDNNIKIDGDISMDEIFFEIPGIVRKDKGIKSKAGLTLMKGEKQTRIERLSYNLDIINVRANGNMENNKKIDLDIAMDIPSIEKGTNLFFLDNDLTKGDLELNLSVRDLYLPLTKLPHINGHVKVNNGFFRLPWLSKPFKEIDLVSDFKGETFDIRMSRLKYGNSVLNSGTLHLEGLESPRLSLHINMENLDLEDFQTSEAFKIPTIYERNLLANVRGDMSLRAKKIHIGNLNGEYLDIKGLFGDRKLNVSELKMSALNGNVDVLGSIDLSGSIPSIYANGRLYRIKSGLFMEAFGAKTYIVDGRSSIHGNVDSRGSTMKELVGDMNGNVAIYSRNGRILKWNLLSKIFGLLNIYDSLRGKVELEKEGLTYSKMGATFTVKNGIFSTKDFLIDSPSTVITGEGSLDIKKNEIEGNIAVSPLVILDRTIDKIPILRNILKEKGKGFLYVAYKVKGHIDNPDINVNFVNSIGGRTIEILKSILVLPKELLEGN